MIAALDRGDADPLDDQADVTNDSTNLLWSGSDSGFTLSTTSKQTFATLPVDQGTVWAGEVNIEIERDDNGGFASDNISYAITVPAGITAFAWVICSANPSTSSGRMDGGAYTGVTDEVIAITTGGVPIANFTTRIYLVVTGDTASGDVLIRMAKGSTDDADNWNVFGRARLTRIRG
jgi:hypothetical protein